MDYLLSEQLFTSAVHLRVHLVKQQLSAEQWELQTGDKYTPIGSDSSI